MYSAREVAQIVGLQESRVRYWAQTGVVGPSERKAGRGVYNFQDVVGVKAAKELLDRGVTLQAVRKNLEALRAQLPHLSQPVAHLRILSDGERLVVTDESSRFEPLSGQLLMEFPLGALEGRAAQLVSLPSAATPAPRAHPERVETAYAWFLEGTRLDGEAGREDEALIAYQKAVEGDPLLAAAHTNLGTLLYRRGVLPEARTHFERALELDGEQPEARYNLANLYDELGERDRALGEWYRVVTACPEFADAHFNLAAVLLEEGAVKRARSHLQAYLKLDGDGEWAGRAREILKGL